MTDEHTCDHEFEIPVFDDLDYKQSERRWMFPDYVLGVSDRIWSCPHDSLDRHDTCLFHTPPEERPDDVDETKSFLKHIKKAEDSISPEESQRKLQFIDAQFTDLQLSGEIIGETINHPINLAFAEISGNDWTDASFSQPIRFSHATFTGEMSFRDVSFEKPVGFRNTTFEDFSNFRGTVFNQSVVFKHSTFKKDVKFWYCKFHSFANFKLCEFKQEAFFKAVDFFDYANFKRVSFDEKSKFELAEFENDADFVEAEFRGEHNFNQANFLRITDFSNVVVNGSLDLSKTFVKEINLTPDEKNDTTQCVDFRQSEIKRGTLSQPPDGDILYDMTDAIVGDVQFTDPNNRIISDHVRFVRTRFDGFVFENDDLNPAASGWKLCDVFNESVLSESSQTELDNESRRQTYLNAKNGADQTGNNTAASAFFYRELTYRRRQYADFVRNTELSLKDRISNANKWLRNATMMVLTGYGERPDRVIYGSIILVSLFAGLYNELSPEDENVVIMDHFIFSLQSFVAFLPGSNTTGPTRIVEFLSTFQAFIGAFFIALFVFTFTRRINR